MPSPSGETVAHRNLKRAALLWAQRHHFRAVAWEVRVPLSSYRADVAAFRPSRDGDSIGTTALFECKQARSDFLKDHHDLSQNLSRLRDLQGRRRRLEKQLGIHYPSLRQGDSLFPEYENVDLSSLPHSGYRSVCRELSLVEKRIYGKTKFYRMAQWKCANLLYLVLPNKLVHAEELPLHWGILTPPSNWDLTESGQPAPSLELQRHPHWLETPEPARLQLLQRIANRATTMTNQLAGLSAEELFPPEAFPSAPG